MRLTYPTRGWAEVRWSEDEEVDASVVDLLTTLSELPGVELEPDSIRVPRNVWWLIPWIDLIRPLDGAPVARLRGVGGLWESKRPLYPHQVEGAQFLVTHSGGLCADAMGVGKTATAIVAAKRHWSR